jgi:hypothetical protein
LFVGAVQPTAVFVPLREMLKPENFGVCTTEIFGPFQVQTILFCRITFGVFFFKHIFIVLGYH